MNKYESKAIVIYDDCDGGSSSSTRRSGAREYMRLFADMAHDVSVRRRPYPCQMADQMAVTCDDDARYERATFMCGQLWKRLPVPELLDIVASFYSSAFGEHAPPCVILPDVTERMRVYAFLCAAVERF